MRLALFKILFAIVGLIAVGSAVLSLSLLIAGEDSTLSQGVAMVSGQILAVIGVWIAIQDHHRNRNDSSE